MHLNLPSLVFASIDLVTLIPLVIPIAGIALAGVLSVSAMYFRHRQRELWHATARVALEKGQPVPPAPPEDYRLHMRVNRERNDFRAGLIFIALGAGLYYCLGGISDGRSAAFGAIPGFIGVALLLNGLFNSLFQKKTPPTDELPPRT